MNHSAGICCSFFFFAKYIPYQTALCRLLLQTAEWLNIVKNTQQLSREERKLLFSNSNLETIKKSLKGLLSHIGFGSSL